jgi:MFS family permease
LTTSYQPSANHRERTAAKFDGPSVFCPECGAQYARGDDSCPRCGYRNYELLAEQLGKRPRARGRHMPAVHGFLAVLAAFFVPLGAFLLILGPAISDGFRRPGSPPFVIGVIAFILGIALVFISFVFSLTWLYQAWRAVLEHDEEYSPGLMVGLLAVPFFNLFWMFRAVPGLSSALQKELAQVAPGRATGAGWTAGLVACIFMLIPYFQPIAICIFIGWMLLANNAVHRLVRIHNRLRAEEETASRSA